MSQYTPLEEIPKIREELRKGFLSGKTKPIAFRKEQLLQLAYLIQDNTQRFKDALASDLGRPPLETDFLEIGGTLSQIHGIYYNIEKWAKPEKPPLTLTWFAMRPSIRKEPKGVVLIISPFNFPIFLLLGPLAAALGAGNSVVLKPSELAPATAALISELVPQYLDSDVVGVVNGAVQETSKLLDLSWDHILYTGSGRVAKIVATAAAKHLTPITTELGGKNPVFIDPKSDLKLAARRISWGRYTNAGQICVSPEYVLVPREIEDRFVKELQEVYSTFYPTDPANSDSFSRIISQQHTARIKQMIDDTKGTIVVGGQADIEKRYIAPTIVRDVPGDDSLMNGEIFGPVLPLVPVRDVEEAIAFVNSKDHPLVLYVFSQDDSFIKKVYDNTQSGGAVANEVVIHVGATGLPFGGIGPSGSGYTTGKAGFDTFTHFRSTMNSPGWLDKLVMFGRFPPYTKDKMSVVKKFSSVKFPPRPTRRPTAGTPILKRWGLWFTLALLGAVSAVLIKRRGGLSLLK